MYLEYIWKTKRAAPVYTSRAGIREERWDGLPRAQRLRPDYQAAMGLGGRLRLADVARLRSLRTGGRLELY